MIFKRAVTPAVLWVLAFLTPPSTLAQQVEALFPGVVRLTALRNDIRKFGTGFVIRVTESEIYIVTASHVVEGDKNPTVEFFTERNSPVSARVLELEGADPRGLALLVVDVDETQRSGVIALPLADAAELEPADRLLLIGMPRQAGPWSALVVSVVNQRGRDIVFSPAADKGYSGGPVVKSRQVVGVVTTKNQDDGWATPVEIIRLFVRSRGIEFAMPVTVGNCSTQVPHLETQVQQSPEDLDSWAALADCYQILGKWQEHVGTQERLLQTEVAFSEMSAVERAQAQSLTHYLLAMTLMLDEVQVLYRDYLERAKFHAERARILGRNSHAYPMSLFLLGFIRAKERTDPPPSSQDVEEFFDGGGIWIDTTTWLSPDLRRNLTLFRYYWFGRALSAVKAYDRAQEELESGLALAMRTQTEDAIQDPDDFLLRLGMNASRKGDGNGARGYWDQMVEPNKLAQSLYQYSMTLWGEGNEAKNAGRDGEARENLQLAADYMEEAERAGYGGWRFLLGRGSLYFVLDDVLSAASDWRRCTELNTTARMCYYMLGRAYRSIEGKLPEAIAALRRAIELDPADDGGYYRLGGAAIENSDFETAARAFEKSIELNPDRVRSYYGMALSLGALAGQAPAHGDSSIALYESNLRYSREGRERAHSTGEHALAEQFESSARSVLNSLAYGYAERRENLTLALEYINEALDLNPAEQELPYFLDTKAWVLVLAADRFAEGEKHAAYEDAEGLLREALEHGYDGNRKAEAETVFHLGYIQQLRGRYDDARNLFLRALRLDPQYEPAKKALNELPRGESSSSGWENAPAAGPNLPS